MSGGAACKCPASRKPMDSRPWFVVARNCNYSAFSGYQWTPSDYSAIVCGECRATWRSKALFVSALPDHDYRNGDVPKDRS